MTTTRNILKTFSALAVAAFILMPHTADARDNDRNNNGNKQNAFQRTDAMRNAHADNRMNGRDRNDRHDRHDNRGGNWDGRGSNWGNHNWNGSRVVHYYPQPVYRYNNYNHAPRIVHYYRPHENVYIGRRVIYRQAPPVHVVRYLQPAPYGYYYSSYNNDVFLVRQQDNVIEQVISMLFN